MQGADVTALSAMTDRERQGFFQGVDTGHHVIHIPTSRRSINFILISFAGNFISLLNPGGRNNLFIHLKVHLSTSLMRLQKLCGFMHRGS